MPERTSDASPSPAPATGDEPEGAWLAALRAGHPGEPINRTVSARDLLGFCAVPPAPAGVAYTRDVVYGRGGDRDLRLRLWVPDDRRRPKPAIVFIHGGAWSGGDPLFHARHASEAASRGWVAVAIEYRLSGEAPFPAAIEDCACAVRWLRAHAGELGVDPTRVAASGGSAGGHLALMLALASGRFEGHGGWAGESSDVQAAAVWYPPTDLRALPDLVDADAAAFLGCPGVGHADLADDLLLAASPIAHVHPAAPPILSIASDDDPVCPLPMIRAFHTALDAAGVPNRLDVHHGEDHGWDVSLATWRPTFEAVMGFLGDALAAPAGA